MEIKTQARHFKPEAQEEPSRMNGIPDFEEISA
jgi:hypothetical protein